MTSLYRYVTLIFGVFMKQILVYGHSHKPGGIETYLVNLVTALKGQVHFDFVSDFCDVAHREILENAGSKIFFIPPKGQGLWAHLKAFRKLLKEHKDYDYIYFNILDSGAAITQLVPFFMRKKIITHSHNGGTDKPRLHKICKPLLKITKGKKVACSLIAAKHMFGTTKNVTIIPNAIDADKFKFNADARSQKRSELGLNEKQIVICHIGRLTYQKNPLGMLDIVKEVLQKTPDATLISIGTGDMDDEVHSYAKKIGIEKNVLFLGKRSDIPELLSASDVFFLPSFYEGLPIVAIEAQASGLPLVISDAISKETDITGNVKFISLNESNETWADALMDASKKDRENNVMNKISEAEYNTGDAEKTAKKLIELFDGITER